MIARLKAKVAAVNRANEYAARLYDDYTKVFAPLVGKAVVKKDGYLLDRIQKLLPQVSEDNVYGTRIYQNIDWHLLMWTVKTCEPLPPHSCIYHEATVYIGNLRGVVLESLANYRFQGRTDYTVEEIEGKRAAYEAAKKVADDARKALDPFGEYDK